MDDQAQVLRRLMEKKSYIPENPPKSTRIITVTSGKGGVGKSNFTLNFALALQEMGYRVLILDADLGLANLDVLMGIRPKYNLYHMLTKRISVWDIIHESHGIQLIAGGSGLSELVAMTEKEQDRFAEQISLLHGHVDFLLLDTGAGISEQTLHFVWSSDETIVVTTPEPTAITDAYALIKSAAFGEGAAATSLPSIRLVINRITAEKEGRQTGDKMHLAARRFLQMELPVLGCVADDPSVVKAVKLQTPLLKAFPNSRAAKNIKDLALRYTSAAGAHAQDKPLPGVKGFLQSMMTWMKGADGNKLR
ncbi:MinD/ParA family protein [Paenibacillus senegalensis]|uniref:MinD/ParA family protein n=1 Tax=Paenibacillus senegalensis TaxID=1465766 RepID=UPI000287FD13|nr:MinD/ParA family protein [Paenibacillus senegalensis]